MANELTDYEQNLVTVVDGHDLSDIIKPFIKEIHLFDSYIAGTTHLEDASVLDNIKEGESLLLRREDNRFDSNAILILNEQDKKLGYVPEKDNTVFARLMDAGKILKAKVNRIEDKGYMKVIGVGIYLVDL
ncbi:MAG: HIRAN domain-containing protein [Lachnospiraceae bacterium]|nr:HIRAN domain-containing protein [Lachnospiraceae bacterium]